LLSRTITAEGEMAIFWGPLSQAIVFGLTFATVLTLVATPAMLALPLAIKDTLKRLRSTLAKGGTSMSKRLPTGG
jgi:multidrug efflux pump